MAVSPGEIISFFKERQGFFENSYGVVMKMEDEGILVTHQLPKLNEMNVSLRLVMDEDSVYSFIDGYKLQRISEIDRISYNYLWMRYVNGEGAFYAKEEVTKSTTDHKDHHGVFSCEIGFRLISSKTIIFCKELNFYDEVDEHVTMPDEFEEFVERMREKLQVAGNKLQNC